MTPLPCEAGADDGTFTPGLSEIVQAPDVAVAGQEGVGAVHGVVQARDAHLGG
jgi:hypothetical protein